MERLWRTGQREWSDKRQHSLQKEARGSEKILPSFSGVKGDGEGRTFGLAVFCHCSLQ